MSRCFTKPGNVVLQNTGGLAARADHEGGRVLIGSTFQVLRLQDERLMPEYLAEMLTNAANRRHALGTGIPLIRLEDCTLRCYHRTLGSVWSTTSPGFIVYKPQHKIASKRQLKHETHSSMASPLDLSRLNNLAANHRWLSSRSSTMVSSKANDWWLPTLLIYVNDVVGKQSSLMSYYLLIESQPRICTGLEILAGLHSTREPNGIRKTQQVVCVDWEF